MLNFIFENRFYALMIKLLTTALFFICGFVKAQTIDFAYSSIKEAVEYGAGEKLIFVDFYASWCGPCKVMETTVFTDSTVARFFNQKFINVKVLTDEPSGKSEAVEYGVREFPTYVFLNRDGEVVHKTIGFHQKDVFLREARKAMHESKSFVSLKELEEQYESGDQQQNAFVDYPKRKSEKDGPQPNLLDKYLQRVPENELMTQKVLELIAENIVSVHSDGFEILANALHRFRGLTDTQQKAILSGISAAKRHTFQKAVETRDDELFNTLINAVHLTAYSREGAISEERQFRYDYAKLTQNFKHFSVIAREEAENILRMSDEDFNRKNEETLENFKNTAELRGITASSGQYQIMLESLQNSAKKSAAFQLNEFAWGYHQMTEDVSQLNHAIRWSAYSIKLYETPANWETYAFLLKKVGRKRDARKAMKQAIKLAKNQGVDPGTLKEAYQKIK
ncbi:thioredoxin domain-containing protein [Jiulongibacter sediminis]|jgi:thiol-disulfide isomerase/thioredoxin/tellurite resistance protein|uniref:thioredoxin family protein n=1 Tax=Jiulongibacter sediminis TaxID=1605367 RepID=UPI0026F310A6|nr:thioredoxin domain-containing protein [Jiulongibacter sediminis]